MRLSVVLLLFVLAMTLPVLAEDWNTADGKTYHNVIVVSQEDDGLRVTYTGGAGKIVNYELPPDVQKKYGLDYASLDAKRLAAEKALAAAKTDEERAAAQKTLDSAKAALKLQQQMGQNPTVVPQNTSQNGSTAQPQGSQSNSAATTSSPNNEQNPAANNPQANPSGAVTTVNPQNPGPKPQPQNNPNPQNPQNTETTDQGQMPAPANNGSPGAAPSDDQTSSTATSDNTANTEAAPAPVDYKNSFPGSKYTYDDIQDVSYLDSPPVNVWIVSPDAAPLPANAPSQGTLTLRITTSGPKVEAPDLIRATFQSVNDIKHIAGNRKIRFLVDGNYISPQESADGNDGQVSDSSQPFRVISFDLEPQQLRAILKGKLVNFSIGTNDYKIDEAGISIFQKYMKDVDYLPPPSFNFGRSYHHFVRGLPSIITMISTVCEYIILSGFGIMMAVVAAAFFLGISKFMKM
jgi:hypothetical protein